MRQARTRIGLNRFRADSIRRKSCRVPCDLRVIGSGYNNDAIDAPTPIGHNAVFDTARQGIALHFKDKRRDHHCDGGAIAREDVLHPALLRLNHGGMDDGVQGLKTPAFKGQFRQPARFSLPSAPTTSGPKTRKISA